MKSSQIKRSRVQVKASKSRASRPIKRGEKVTIPDFLGRLKANFGGRMLSEAEAAWLDENNKGNY